MDRRSRAPAADVLEARPPSFSASEAEQLAKDLFGLEGGATELASERDQNFLIRSDSGPLGVLKVFNPAESADVVDMENAAALHAKRVDPGLPVALPFETGPGEGIERYRASAIGPAGDRHWVRMAEFVPGEASFDPSRLGHDELWAFGGIVARLGRALRSFFHPAAGRTLLWDVQRHALLRPLAADAPDPGRRALLLRTLDRLDERLTPRWPHLRSQFIHGDLSADNTTIDERGRVSGIIDFGDATHTALACDISSAWASLVWDRRGAELEVAAAALVDGYQEVTPLEQVELDALGDLFAARAAAAAAISARRVAQHPDNAYIASFDEHAWPLLELYDELGPDEMSRRFGAPDYTDATRIDGLLERRQDALGSALLAPTYRRPLHLVRARGVWMSDPEGRRYLDAYNNVPVLGHSHPRVVEAIARQSRRLNTNMRYLHEAAIELAERLVASMPDGSGLDTVTLLNSGSEANDLAWRLATACTGASGALVSEFAYHGISAAIADLSPETWRESRPDHVETFAPPSGAGPGIDEAIDRLAERDISPAATFVDGAFTSDGVHRPDPGWLEGLVRATHDAGGLYVADEVQAGHGRTGEHLWSFAASGIEPDIVTLGKPMGNGYPVAALITRSELADRFAAGAELFSTFGGNPPAAVAALTVLDVIEDEGLIERARLVGATLREAIAGVADGRAAIGSIRGWGMTNGVEVVTPDEGRPDPELADRVANGMRERGVLVGTTGAHGTALKIRPPLAFGPEHVELLAAALQGALAEA